MMTQLDLSIVILTHNEEKHIARCLKSSMLVARDIFVIDSFSSDQTVSIMEIFGVRVWQHEFTNYSAQFTWALDTIPFRTTWVMRVDADEIITDELATSMRRCLTKAPAQISGFLVNRYIRFMGQLIQHGNFPQWHLRIWRTGQAEIEQRWMDEHMVLKEGGVQKLDGKFIDDNLNSISWWTDKHNHYASREAIDLLDRKYGFLKGLESSSDLSVGARSKRWVKENIYAKLPLGLRAFAYFCFRMVFQLGVLDGRKGAVFHFLQGFWYRFLVDAKVMEVEQDMARQGKGCVESIRTQLGIDPLHGADQRT